MADTDDIQTGTEGPIASPQDAKLDVLSKSEDISSYIAERQAQDAEDAGQEPETPEAERTNRIEEALTKAREETRKAREADNQIDREYAEAERAWQQQQAQEQQAAQQYANELSYYEARGRCQAACEQLKQAAPALYTTIYNNLTSMEGVLDDAQIKTLERAFAFYPEAVLNLGARLSDDSDGKSWSEKVEMIRAASPEEIWQGAVQGAAQLQQERYVQSRIMRDRAERGRQFTQAPPPFRSPSGGANPPKDIYRAANKDNASDYIKMRRAQNARAERD